MSKPDKSGAFLRPSRKPPAATDWLTTPEAAAHLGLNPKTLANMRCLGTGPAFHKIGSKVWYRGEDLIAYRSGRKYIASGVRDER